MLLLAVYICIYVPMCFILCISEPCVLLRDDCNICTFHLLTIVVCICNVDMITKAEKCLLDLPSFSAVDVGFRYLID